MSNNNNATNRFLINESNDTISNTEVIDEGDVVAAESCVKNTDESNKHNYDCLLYTSPSPRDQRGSRMPSSA